MIFLKRIRDRGEITEDLTADERFWARLVSDLFSPPIVWGFMAFPLSSVGTNSWQTALAWALIYIMLVCVLPAVYIVYGVHKGRITDRHIRIRRQRMLPLAVTLLCTALAFLGTSWLGAPPLLPRLALFTLIEVILIMVITFAWQISIHAASISGAVVVLAMMFGPLPALVIFPFVPLVGTARVKLRRHTVRQVLAGVLVGALCAWLMFLAVQRL